MKRYIDQNGNQLHRHLAKATDGTWGVNVFAGTYPLMTTTARHYYQTKAQAMDADIQDSCLQDHRGLVRVAPYDNHLASND